MTKFVHVNNHLIQIPEGVSVVYGGSGPGAWDNLTFKGYDICTSENCVTDDEGVYVGPFFVSRADELYDALEFENLELVVDYINEQIS